MQVKGSSNRGSRWVQRALIAAAVVALLAGAAYVWGNRLNADTQHVGTQRSADASASRYGSLRGLAAVRAVDVVAAPRTSVLQGVAAVRALEVEAAPRAGALQGVAAVRAADRTAASANDAGVIIIDAHEAAARAQRARAGGAIQVTSGVRVERHVPDGGR